MIPELVDLSGIEPTGNRPLFDVLGISNSVVFPDLAGLSLELKHRFRTDLDR